MSGYLRPVPFTRTSSWFSHQLRRPRSTEPGTDLYCPIGTPVLAPADGRVYAVGTSIGPATGRWVGIDFNDGRRFRALHLARIDKWPGQTVRRGEVIGLSGASGYGEEDWSWNPATGGAHVHVTLWPSRQMLFGYRPNGTPYTLDFMEYLDQSAPAGGDETELDAKKPIEQSEEDDMGFYFYDTSDPNRPYGFWNESRGKARLLTTPEWEWRKAVANTRRGVKFDLVPVSSGWYDKAIALGTY